MKFHTLGQKIGLGYMLMVGVLGAAILLNIWGIRGLRLVTQRLIDLHEPTSKAGLELKNGFSKAVAALRGWIIVADQRFKTERRQAWSDEIRVPLSRLEALSQRWSTDTIIRLNTVKPLIDQLETYHDQVEELAISDRDGAVKLLQTQAIPLAFQINDILDMMVDDQRKRLRAEFSNVSDQVRFLSNLDWTLLGFGLIACFLLSIFITRSVTGPIASAVAVADNIGQGDLDADVNLSGSREVEVLGAALINMRNSLKVKTKQNDRFNWLSAGQNRLGETMRGDQNLEALATSIITFLASYTGANIGSLYLADDTRSELSLMGGYAFGGGDVKNCFKMGEGLVGQVAVGNKPYLLTAVRADYVRVRSSLIDAPPRSLYLCPFSFEDSTFGVLELGKLDPFDEVEQEFVQSNMEAVAIAMNSAIARKKIQRLLEETQQQSLELRQQQEELEQTNEELEEQTQKLEEQQEELQAANEELEEQTQVIVQRNKDLETARDNIELKARQLEVSSKYKSEFLANMSHELRTPLNSLLILSNDLANNSAGNLNAEQIESAQVINKSGHDLLNLINDILDLSKVEAGKLALNAANIRINDFTEGIRRNFERSSREKGLQLIVSLDPSLPDTMRTDRNRLEQVLNNLITNALKFTDDGEVNISFQRDPGGYLSVAVSDTGIGIPADKLDAIFEAFVQVEGGPARKYGGTGLGLSICRELARLLGGSVTVKSEPGKGSTFTLVIPLEITGHQPAAELSEPKGTRKEIVVDAGRSRFFDYPTIADQRDHIGDDDPVVLIIEDDDKFASILAAQASEKGFKHINAASGEDGLRLASQFQPQAIILDLGLPGIDGHMVLKELKGDPQLRHIPVHIMSVNEKTLDPIRSGAVGYLSKPVNRAQLDDAFSRIEDFVNRKVKNLLIVEDNDEMRKAIVKLIGNGDVKCFEASTAREALQVHRDQAIDCMVLDVGLPDISGFELIRILEKEHENRMPPIIVYTGKELTKQENDELQQYAETIIVKGVKSDERLLDETALFLHRTVKDLPAPKNEMITRLYDKEGVLQGKRVLLVDDDMRNVFALSKVLKDRGMEVVKAENGCTALELLNTGPEMDFVLMDIMMPEMDGYECMRRIRKRREFRDLPIVALTAKAMKDDRQKCIQAGANDYISKPVDIERLVSLMRIWIRK